MDITITKESIFPYLPLSNEKRFEEFNWIYRESYHSGSLILPPNDGEFQYIWSKFIFPNKESFLINYEGSFDLDRAITNLAEKFPLQDLVKVVQDHELTDKIVCCAIIAGYNVFSAIRSKKFTEKECVYSRVNYIIPSYNHINHFIEARTDIAIFKEFRYKIVLKLGSSRILDLKYALITNDVHSFWYKIAEIHDLKNYVYDIYKLRDILSEHRLLQISPKAKRFIVDEYQEREDDDTEISKAQIVSMLERIEVSNKTLELIRKVLKCHL